MKAAVKKKCISIIIISIFLLSIVTILPSAISISDETDESRSGPSSRAAPEITRINNINVVNSKITIPGKQDEWINLTVYAKDSDGDELVFIDKSDKFVIEKEGKEGEFWLGNITFLPRNSDVGNFTAPVVVKEKDGPAQHEITITFDIENKNDPPILDPIEDLVIYQDKMGNITPTATDIDLILEEQNIPGVDEELTFSNNLTFAVPGVELNENYFFTPSTGKFQFRPDNSMVGKYRVRFKVEDLKREFDEQVINLTVLNVNDPPATPDIINPTSSLFYTNSQIVFRGRCDDPDLEVASANEELNYTWVSTMNELDTVLGYGNDITVKDLPIGNHTVTLTVRDKAGLESRTSIDIAVKSLFQLTPKDAAMTYSDEKLDLLLFTSNDGVKFEQDFSQNYPSVDIVTISSKLDVLDLVITVELQGAIKNTTGYNYYVYVVKSSHAEDELQMSGSSLPTFYSPQVTEIYHTFTFEGGKGFVSKIGTDESFRIFDSNKMEFRIRVTYLETIAGMPENFGIFGVARYSTQSGSLEGQYVYTYDALGTGGIEAQPPPQIEDIGSEAGLLSEPFVQAALLIIVLIIVIIIVMYVVKIRKEKKDLVAPPSYDYKFVSGLQDQDQYESLYGKGGTQTQMAMGGMPPGMPPPMPGMPPGMPPGAPMPPGRPMPPGAPPGGPGAKPQAGTSCPKCGKAIVIGMSKCPHCSASL
jgi:hypothetical protein